MVIRGHYMVIICLRKEKYSDIFQSFFQHELPYNAHELP